MDTECTGCNAPRRALEETEDETIGRENDGEKDGGEPETMCLVVRSN
jgi:hypothetical protein